VFDRRHARLDRVPRAAAGERVRGDFAARPAGLLHGEPEVLHGIDVGLVVHDDLDHLRAVVDVLADRLPELVARVGVEVLRVAHVAPLGRELAELSPVGGDDAAGVEDRGARDEPFFDRAAKVGVRVEGRVPDVAHGGEPRLEHLPRVRGPFERAVARRLHQGHPEERAKERLKVRAFGLGRPGAEMGVAVEESRQHRNVAQVDHLRPGRDLHTTGGADLGPFDQDDRVRRDGTRLGVQQPPGPDGHHSRVRAHQANKTNGLFC